LGVLLEPWFLIEFFERGVVWCSKTFGVGVKQDYGVKPFSDKKDVFHKKTLFHIRQHLFFLS